jgi:hypothetical protein
MLARTKFTISSNENIFTLFNIECINNNVKIFSNIKYIPKSSFFKKKFVSFEKINEVTGFSLIIYFLLANCFL